MSKRRDSLTISEDLTNVFSDRLKSDPRKERDCRKSLYVQSNNRQSARDNCALLHYL